MSTAHDFDFLAGRWLVHHRKLRRRLAACDEWDTFDGTCDCRPAATGFGNVDDNRLDDPNGAYGAFSVRTFDPVDRVWSIWWFDERSPRRIDPPVVGRFIDGVGTFDTADTLDGNPILVRFRWTDTTTGSPRWEQAFSDDAGTTWETNWTMHFTRADG